jgi:cytochrome d ubiquinol oxidase subunit I
MAMWMATIVAPIQIVAGDQQPQHAGAQPVKIMAMEGHFESHGRALYCSRPNQAAENWSTRSGFQNSAL